MQLHFLLSRLKRPHVTPLLRVLLILSIAWAAVSLSKPPRVLAQADSSQIEKQLPVFHPAQCPVPIPKDLTVQCGYLEVLEDRSQPGGNTIQLAIAIIKSTGKHPQPDPLLFLQGGPGAGAVGWISTGAGPFFAPFLLNRDVILFDQRGVGWSQPRLNCPGQETFSTQFAGQALSLEEVLPEARRMVSECRAALSGRGIHLETYNSAANAADVEDLRLALGYEKVNLFGASYGTRLALTVLRDHPNGLRSIILDSTFPPAVNTFRDGIANSNRAFETLFTSCAEDTLCNLVYPNLHSVFYDLVDRLDAQPVTLQSTNPDTDEPVEITLNGVAITGMIFGQLYRTAILGRLPAIIYDAADGEFSAIEDIYWASSSLAEEFALGMSLSVMCSEEAPFADPQFTGDQQYPPALQRERQYMMLSGRLGLEVCQVWNAPPASPAEEQPVSGSVPTLILAGQFDPVTPPENGRLAAATLSNSYFYEFPGVGHNVLASGACAKGIALSFLNDPTHSPRARCIEEMDPPDFILRARIARPWVGLACLALLAALGWSIYRQAGKLWQNRQQFDWKTGRWNSNLAFAALTILLIIASLALNLAGADLEKFQALKTERLVESIISLILAIQVALAFTPEDEPGLEVLLACPRPPPWLLLERLGPILALQTGIALLSSLVIWWMAGGSLILALLRWIPPTIFLGSLAIYMNLVTHRSAFSVSLLNLMWWALAFLGVYLVQRWPIFWPAHIYLQPDELPLVEYLLNRIFITLVGAGIIGLAARIMQHEERVLTGNSQR